MFSQKNLSSNPTKIKAGETVPCYKSKLKRPSIGIANVQRIFTTCFGHEMV